MEEEDIVSLANLLSALKDYSVKLEEAVKENDLEKINGIKKEILIVSREVDKIL